MNRKQIKCLWIGIGIFVIMGLFPPRITSEPTFVEPGGRSWSLEYSFLLRQFDDIDILRLSIQWIIVAVITGGMFLTFHGQGKNRQNGAL